MATIIRENKHARILSHARGASYEVQERVKNKWETVTIFHGSRSTALHLYGRLTKKKSGYIDWAKKYPWHVGKAPYPKDKQGNCICDCKYCTKMYTHKATARAHM